MSARISRAEEFLIENNIAWGRSPQRRLWLGCIACRLFAEGKTHSGEINACLNQKGDALGKFLKHLAQTGVLNTWVESGADRADSIGGLRRVYSPAAYSRLGQAFLISLEVPKQCPPFARRPQSALGQECERRRCALDEAAVNERCMAIMETLAQAREEQMPQAEMANLLGVVPSRVSAFESHPSHRLPTLIAYAYLVGLEITSTPIPEAQALEED